MKGVRNHRLSVKYALKNSADVLKEINRLQWKGEGEWMLLLEFVISAFEEQLAEQRGGWD